MASRFDGSMFSIKILISVTDGLYSTITTMRNINKCLCVRVCAMCALCSACRTAARWLPFLFFFLFFYSSAKQQPLTVCLSVCTVHFTLTHKFTQIKRHVLLTSASLPISCGYIRCTSCSGYTVRVPKTSTRQKYRQTRYTQVTHSLICY